MVTDLTPQPHYHHWPLSQLEPGEHLEVYYHLNLSNWFVLLLLPGNIILHTSPNDVNFFWMRNHHPKLPLYQLLLIFHVELPPQGMNFNLVLIITLGNILPIFHLSSKKILLHLQVRVPLVPRLFSNIYFDLSLKNITNKIIMDI